MSNQMISVDIAKLGMGMKSIFTGCALLFDSLGVSGEAMEQMNELADTAVKQSAPVAEKQNSPSKTQQTESTAAVTGNAAATEAVATGNATATKAAVTDKATTQAAATGNATTTQAAKTAAEDFPPADDEPPFDTEDKPAVQISVKDLQKVAAQKITSNRKNSAKIQQLLTTYGCGTMSEIPEEKREAFLNDLAQL